MTVLIGLVRNIVIIFHNSCLSNYCSISYTIYLSNLSSSFSTGSQLIQHRGIILTESFIGTNDTNV